MRDEFAFTTSMNTEESKETCNATEEMKYKGIHTSTNGYYGYQFVQANQTEEICESMEIQYNNADPDSDIQFNNFIRPEDRLCCDPLAANMREPVNRKRRLNYDNAGDCKKRRESDINPETHRKLIPRQPTHNVPDFPRNLMGHFI
ncbi:uncharacterized protein LOC116167685 isoform X2 [Photinus pyralis]|uniref:Uncharacterized protein n=1 Tax=Photinus pyralis TaxID=7054 RepID=A0A1Y1LD76_PHOPY|nr:uncharacterized protein LOC116167685 isoform X2 [Photinus pyralis]